MRSPFKFLDAYTVQDKHVFFGRDTEIETLYSLVFKTNLLIVYGLSGTGKTSLIQCGLASRFDGPDWYPLFIRRNENLNDAIDLTMRNALGDEVKEDLLGNVSYLLRKTLRPVYLIFDQFEELFILGTHEEQETFMKNVKALLDAGVNAKVVLVMREEYIGQLYPFEQIIPQLFDFRFRVEPMGIAKVKTVIQDSFDTFNIHLEEPKEDTVQFMVEQITDPKTGIALPYLQVYLDMLYRVTYRKKYGKEGTEEALPSLDIMRQDIASLGRIDNVLEKFLLQQTAELNGVLHTEFPAFPVNGIQMILDVFATEDGTKRPLNYVRNGEQIELDTAVQKVLPSFPDGSLSRALELLEQARILRMREDTIELAHDSLAAIIDRKRTDEQRQMQELRRRLVNAYEEFQKTGVYLNAKQLAAFEEFLPKLQLTDEVLQFIRNSDDHVRHEAEADRQRQQQEQESKHHKKLARIRGILLALVAIFAGGVVLFAIWSQRNLTKANVAIENYNAQSALLVAQMDTTKSQQDSIENILTQVNQQLVRMEAVANGDVPNYRIEIQKSILTLKSLISQDTISKEELAQHASVQDLFTTTGVNDQDKPGPPARTFGVREEVFLFAHIETKQHRELLQVKWFGRDGKIVGDPTYLEIEETANGVAPMSASARFDVSGPHEVRLYNSLGAEIGGTKFDITDVQPSPLQVSSPGDFKIVSSVIKNVPGDEEQKFRAGSTVYYWGRIYCPVPSDFITVQITEPNGEQWERKHDINMNTNPGYMIWSAKGFDQTGVYHVRVLNSQGGVMVEKQFTME